MRTGCSRRNDGPGGGRRSGTARRIAGRGRRPRRRVRRGRRPRRGVVGVVVGWRRRRPWRVGVASASAARRPLGGPSRRGVGRRPRRSRRRPRSAASPVSERPDDPRAARRPGPRRGLGQERVGLGLEVGDLGLELEPQDLALDLGSGGASAWASAGDDASVRIVAADPRQQPAARRRRLLAAQDAWRRPRSRRAASGSSSDDQDRAARRAGRRSRASAAAEHHGQTVPVGRSSRRSGRPCDQILAASETPFDGPSVRGDGESAPAHSHSMVAGGLELMS